MMAGFTQYANKKPNKPSHWIYTYNNSASAQVANVLTREGKNTNLTFLYSKGMFVKIIA